MTFPFDLARSGQSDKQRYEDDDRDWYADEKQ
jgi:hypothetical protein